MFTSRGVPKFSGFYLEVDQVEINNILRWGRRREN
jgi:hypothetical protein